MPAATRLFRVQLGAQLFGDQVVSVPELNDAAKEQNLTAEVLVQGRRRNMRPSCASGKKTGRKETTMITKEKNSAGPTCLAASIKILRRSFSRSSGLRRMGEE